MTIKMSTAMESRIAYYRSNGLTDKEIKKELELELQLKLCTRTANALRRAGIRTIKELQKFYNKGNGEHSLLSLRNMGKKSVLEIKGKCKIEGIELINTNKKCLYCGK